MNKLIIYSNERLKGKIELKKIGLIFRNLNDEEKSLIIENYRKIIINKKNKNLAKKYKDIRENRERYERKEVEDTYSALIKMEERDKFLYDVIFSLYLDIIKNSFERMNLTYIKQYIKKLIVVEIDFEKFTKQFEEKYIKTLLPKILDFSNYISTTDGEIKEFNAFPFDFDMIANEQNQYHIKSLGLLLNEYETNNSFNMKNLEKLEKLLNKHDAEFNFNFMVIIDNMFRDDSLVENRIVNKVAFLERLLITKEDNKQETFILKVGILCNGLLGISNEKLSKQLKEIYKIRSSIVHGDSDTIINNIEKYKSIFSDLIEKGKSKFETKMNILIAVDAILEFYFIEVLKKYLENYELCEYMKKN